MKIHSIQKKILLKFLQSRSLRFTDAKPEDIDNDSYNYHLKQLITKDIIKKENDGYRISEEGLHILEEEYPINPLGHKAARFKVASIFIVFDQHNSKILFQKRKRNPGYGRIQIPGGPLFKGEMPEETASRKLTEETGLIAPPESFTLLGIIRKIRFDKYNEIFSDIFYHVSLLTEYSGILETQTIFGKHMWLSIEEAIEIEENETLVDIYQQIGKDTEISFFYTTSTK